MTDFEVKGVDELIKKINRHQKRFDDDVAAVVMATAQMTARNARDILTSGGHVKTGDLRSSIAQRDVSRKLGRSKGTARTVTPRGRKGRHKALFTYGSGERSVKEENRNRFGINRGKMPSNPFLDRAEAIVERQHFEALRRIAERKTEL